MDVRRRIVLLAVLALMAGGLAMAGPAAAEEPAGLPEGKAVLHLTVLDTQRRALPGVTLCLKNERGIRIEVTDDKGVSVMQVPGGEYSLKAQLEVFVTQEITGIQLVDEKELRLDVILVEQEGDVLISIVEGEPYEAC